MGAVVGPEQSQSAYDGMPIQVVVQAPATDGMSPEVIVAIVASIVVPISLWVADKWWVSRTGRHLTGHKK